MKRPAERIPRKRNTAVDVAVIGGGIAGCVAASRLALSGVNTVIIEKEPKAHHKVCGEFLSHEGAVILAELGVDVPRMGAARIRAFRLHGPKRSFEFALPQDAFGISRLRLDEELLTQAKRHGAEVKRGSVAMGISARPNGNLSEFAVNTTTGDVRVRRLVIATGKHEFKSIAKREGRESGWVGFKMHLRLKPSLAVQIREHCDLFVFEGGYGGLAPIENGLVNFCLVIRKHALREAGSDWDSLACYISRQNRAASRYLDGAEAQLAHAVSVANVPYGFIQSAAPGPGIYCVGDQMTVIPSLSGDGMSIAAMTGVAAAAAIVDVKERGHLLPPSTAASYHRQMRTRLKMQIEAAFVLHRLLRKPRLIDRLVPVAGRLPGLVEFFYRRTRCRLDEPLLVIPEIQTSR